MSQPGNSAVSQLSGIERAVAQIGSQSALAKALADCGHGAITPQAIQQWVERGYVPPLRIAIVSELTGVRPADLAHPAMRRLFDCSPAS